MALTVMHVAESLINCDKDYEIASMYTSFKNGKNVVVVCVRLVDDNGEHKTGRFIIEE